MPSVSPADTVALLAVRLPAATRVFARHDIDFCCGGQRSVRDACAERGLDPEAVIAEIELAQAAHPSAESWETRPLVELVDHIVSRFHRPLEEEMPRLLAMARKVEEVHRDRDPERLAALAETCEALFLELTDHMMKEERVLFPWIAAGNGRMAGAPIRVMNAEHEDAGRALARIRELTDDFVPPAGACVTWRALWLGLAELDREMREHIHLENNVLFPRALAS